MRPSVSTRRFWLLDSRMPCALSLRDSRGNSNARRRVDRAGSTDIRATPAPRAAMSSVVTSAHREGCGRDRRGCLRTHEAWEGRDPGNGGEALQKHLATDAAPWDRAHLLVRAIDEGFTAHRRQP